MTTFEWLGRCTVGAIWPTGHKLSRRDRDIVLSIRRYSDSLRTLTEHQLGTRAEQVRQSVHAGTNPLARDILITSFALVNEAIRRVLGISYYDVQLLAGLTLARGRVAEMQTGEGKTIVAALPAFIHALSGSGVHVMTVNDYLARRDYEQLSPVYNLLGMSIGFVGSESDPSRKRHAYACDVTYGPSYEFGFDYLRDQAAMLATRKSRLGDRYRNRLRGRRDPTSSRMQRSLSFCVVDEIDSVLIDEASTPLVLAEGHGATSNDNKAYLLAQQSANALREGHDYVIDQQNHGISLTETGIRRIADTGRAAARGGLLRPWSTYVRQALHANSLLQKDVDYIVDDERVLLVDKNTGRIFPDRSWRDGLHQAVETKEGLPLTPEQKPVGHITRQRFFQLYEAKCGMTGTATGNENEFQHFYRLPVVVIPTHKPSRRIELPTRFFATQEAKLNAVVADIKRIHATRQPILIGTRTIEASETLADILHVHNIPFRLLNGKQDEHEAHVVAKAGELGAVTIATNMAGRGTDIRLAAGAAQRGGLHVVGTERHESARVDRQLVGRAARQGDPGSCQFFVSADDPLVTEHAPSLGQQLKHRADDVGEVHADFSRAVAKTQQRIERLRFTERQQMFAHDHWLETVLATLAEER